MKSHPRILAFFASLAIPATLADCDRSAAPLPSQITSDAAPSHQRALGSACTWSTVKTPNKGTKLGDSNILSAIATRTASDVWAAGDFYDYQASLYHTLAEHWNGTRWKLSPSLDAGTQQSEFYGVTVAGSRDVWAVGYSQNTGISAPYYTLIEHWNGHAWSIAQSDSQLGVLNAAAAAGPNDIWAVGTKNYPGPGVIEHWNGKQWSYSLITLTAEFRSVAVIAPNDVWAVGERTASGGADKTLTYHFDGTQWRHIPSPSPLHLHYADQNWLTAVVPLASNDVWALGMTRDEDYGILDQPLSLHWNGQRWKVVNFPPPGGSKQYNSIWGGTALAAHDVWAVGEVGVNTFQTLAVLWNRSGWSQVPTPPEQTANLWAAASNAARGVWAVGEAELKPYVTGTLALRCE